MIQVAINEAHYTSAQCVLLLLTKALTDVCVTSEAALLNIENISVSTELMYGV